MQDILDRKAICSQLETLEKRAIIYNFIQTTFHHIVDACVEFCFLKKEFLNLTINMQLLVISCETSKQSHVSPLANCILSEFMTQAWLLEYKFLLGVALRGLTLHACLNFNCW